MTDRITGQVAQVTSDRELIINRGSAHGVEQGTYFRVKGAPIEVVDPETGESLGTVSDVKVVVRAEEVAEKFCIARTFRTHRVMVSPESRGIDLGVGTLARALQPSQPAKFEVRVETFRADPRKGSPIGVQESVVGVGDHVESVSEGDELDPVTTTLFK